MFAVVENGVITEMCCGSKEPYEGRADLIDLPDDTDARVGTRKSELTEDGYARPVGELVALGFLEVDEYHVLESGGIRKKTDLELMLDGHLPVPIGYKVEDGALVPLSAAERIADGLVTLQPDEALVGGDIIRIPEGWKVQDGLLVEMTLQEAIEAGHVIIPYGSVYDSETDVIREMTVRERVSAGLETVPHGSILDGESIREMTQDERYLSGVDGLPYNMQIVDGKLVEYTEAEMDRMRWDADLTAWKESACDAAEEELAASLKAGFSYGGATIQADAVAQQNANGYLSMMTNGVQVLPIIWRTKDNAYHQFTDEAEFRTFCGAMLEFVQSRYRATWAAKDAIRLAQKYEDAVAARKSIA